MSSNSDTDPEDVIERGLDAYFTADTARYLLEAIDREELIEGTTVEETVDYEKVGELLGRLMARSIVKELSRRSLLGQFIETTIGQEIGGQLGEAAVREFVESGGPEAITDLGDEITAATRDIGLPNGFLDSLGEESPDWDGADVTSIDITDAEDE